MRLTSGTSVSKTVVNKLELTMKIVGFGSINSYSYHKSVAYIKFGLGGGYGRVGFMQKKKKNKLRLINITVAGKHVIDVYKRQVVTLYTRRRILNRLWQKTRC